MTAHDFVLGGQLLRPGLKISHTLTESAVAVVRLRRLAFIRGFIDNVHAEVRLTFFNIRRVHIPYPYSCGDHTGYCTFWTTYFNTSFYKHMLCCVLNFRNL